MITTLEEAISHAKEVAENWKSQLVNCVSEEGRNKCLECVAEHEKTAEWLTELQERREADRWNVIYSEKDLPKYDGFYLVTIEYRESSSGKLKRNTSELYFSTGFQRWTDCGEEFVEDGVIAWKPLPKPYESEAEE